MNETKEMTVASTVVEDIDFSPALASTFLQGQSDGESELLNESVARIESLKIKILEWPNLSERLKHDFFADLDALRGAFVQCSSLRIPPSAPQPVEFPQRRKRDGKSTLKLEGILGQSRRIQKVLRIVRKVAPTDMAVLMEGETGSGKELFARIIHLNSNRERFVAVNCGAFPTGLIESELFGHVRGAFTGASSDRKGKFEEADGGTIFLDELGELDTTAQVKLLRTLEAGELQRVGSDKSYRVDVRVVAATNRDLAQMVKQGQFREDLYYRVNMCPLYIPPLRERRDEIRVLLEYFMTDVCGPLGKSIPVLDKTLRKFIYEYYEFPGNIRELKNLAHYLAHIADGHKLVLDDLPETYRIKSSGLVTAEKDLGGDPSQLVGVRSRAEKQYLADALERHNGKVTKVCQDTGLSRSRLYQLFAKHEIDPSGYR